MPTEKALAVPFEASEVIDILCDEFRRRLAANCYFQRRQEYASFRAEFDVRVRLKTVARVEVDTVVWDKPYRDPKVEGTEGEEVVADIPVTEFASKEPNAERMERGMPLTVEDKKGNRRKVRVSDAEAVSK